LKPRELDEDDCATAAVSFIAGQGAEQVGGDEAEQEEGEDAEQLEGKEAAAATGAGVGEVAGDKTLEAMQPEEASGAVNSTNNNDLKSPEGDASDDETKVNGKPQSQPVLKPDCSCRSKWVRLRCNLCRRQFDPRFETYLRKQHLLLNIQLHC
jgi:hypothetical protein